MQMTQRTFSVIVVFSLILVQGSSVACSGTTGMRPNSPSHVPESKGKIIATAYGPIKLGADAVTVTLSPSAAGDREVTNLSLALKSLTGDQRLYLVLRDLQASQPPGVLYDLYVDLPIGPRPGENDPHYGGAFDFYNAVGVAAPNPTIFSSYDITDVVKALQTRNLLSERTTVTIYPLGKPASNAKPVVGRIELVQQ
jgi:hypothetical protein